MALVAMLHQHRPNLVLEEHPVLCRCGFRLHKPLTGDCDEGVATKKCDNSIHGGAKSKARDIGQDSLQIIAEVPRQSNIRRLRVAEDLELKKTGFSEKAGFWVLSVGKRFLDQRRQVEAAAPYGVHDRVGLHFLFELLDSDHDPFDLIASMADVAQPIDEF